MSVAIRPVESKDRAAWETLWRESVAADGTLETRAVEVTWGHLKASATPMGMGGLVAVNEDGGADSGLFGLLHYVVHPVAGAAAPVCYLQDVYVSPAHRRRGVGSAMLAMLGNMGDALGWDRIYWLVEGRNAAAKAFYKGRSVNVDFDLHVLPLRLLRDMDTK